MAGKLEAVIVTYNSAGVIGDCLEACKGLPVLVIDNASSDRTLDEVRRHPDVRIIANPVNYGFAGAVNRAVEETQAEFILLLNPDVRLRGPVAPLLQACGSPGVGIAAGRLESESGQAQAGFTVRRFPTPLTLIFEALGWNRLFPGNPVNRRYRCLGLDLSRPAEVEQPAGAFLLFRLEAWRRAGGFDAGFFPVWFEDVDFCKRIAALGYKIRYVPEVAAVHRGAHSIKPLDWESRELYWYGSLLRYASKHFRPSACYLVGGAVVAGSVLRMAAGVMVRRNREPIRVYWRVIRLALRGLIYGPKLGTGF